MCPVILLFNAHQLLLSFRLFPQVHLLIDDLVKGQYVTLVVQHDDDDDDDIVINSGLAHL